MAQLRCRAAAHQDGFRRQPAQLQQRGVKVEQFDRLGQRVPGRMPGPAKTRGTRVDRSHRLPMPVMSFLPRCLPLSDENTTTVLVVRPGVPSASSRWPIWWSMNAVLARYVRTRGRH